MKSGRKSLSFKKKKSCDGWPGASGAQSLRGQGRRVSLIAPPPLSERTCVPAPPITCSSLHYPRSGHPNPSSRPHEHYRSQCHGSTSAIELLVLLVAARVLPPVPPSCGLSPWLTRAAAAQAHGEEEPMRRRRTVSTSASPDPFLSYLGIPCIFRTISYSVDG